ncbi:MAG: UDP-N-acetylmuramate dehydrogenase [Parcubacteria group bacterium]
MSLGVQENVALAPLTTLKVGGPARYFMSVTSAQELGEALQFAQNKKVPVLVLGGGSNLLVSDEGFGGLVIELKTTGISGDVRGNRVLLWAAAGEPWDKVVVYAVEQGWGGIENLSGVPGSTGGALVQNIGAYGQTLADSVREVETVEIATGVTKTFNRAACKFAYRESFFKHAASGRYVVTSVTLQLKSQANINISYKDMRGGLAKVLDGKALTLKTVREAVIETRARKGMVILPDYEALQSVGSFFLNPIVTARQFGQVRTAAEKIDAAKTKKLEPWHWDLPGGAVKLSAAFLNEFTPYPKGYRQGNVGVSARHSLALVTYPGATADEFVKLARVVQQAVKDRFGIVLKAEAQLVGFSKRMLH